MQHPRSIVRSSLSRCSQMALLCVWRIIMREDDSRAFFFALRLIAVEKQRCERVLGLLLPPTLVTSSELYLFIYF